MALFNKKPKKKSIKALFDEVDKQEKEGSISSSEASFRRAELFEQKRKKPFSL